MLLALVHNIIANINGESPYEERRPTEMCNPTCENPLDLHPHILTYILKKINSMIVNKLLQNFLKLKTAATLFCLKFFCDKPAIGALVRLPLIFSINVQCNYCKNIFLTQK